MNERMPTRTSVVLCVAETTCTALSDTLILQHERHERKSEEQMGCSRIVHDTCSRHPRSDHKQARNV